MTSVISKLPIVILNVHTRCNCRCAMCDIWKVTETRDMSVEFVEDQLSDFVKLGVEWVVLSGGEPLMHSHVFELAKLLRSRRIRVTMLTSGLLIHRYVREIATYIDDLIVSVDGPPEVHDGIRGVSGAFELLRKGISHLHCCRPDYSVAARCTVQKRNHRKLRETVGAARQLGLTSVSFLAVDVSSTAFNRETFWDEAKKRDVMLTADEIAGLDAEVEALIVSRDPLVRDRPDHLRRIVNQFRAHARILNHTSPRYNAPWISAVIEVDGRVRPCFFHREIGRIDGGFVNAVNGSDAVSFRQSLDIATNETCKRCVCSLFRNDS